MQLSSAEMNETPPLRNVKLFLGLFNEKLQFLNVALRPETLAFFLSIHLVKKVMPGPVTFHAKSWEGNLHVIRKNIKLKNISLKSKQDH